MWEKKVVHLGWRPIRSFTLKMIGAAGGKVSRATHLINS